MIKRIMNFLCPFVFRRNISHNEKKEIMKILSVREVF